MFSYDTSRQHHSNVDLPCSSVFLYNVVDTSVSVTALGRRQPRTGHIGPTGAMGKSPAVLSAEQDHVFTLLDREMKAHKQLSRAIGHQCSPFML